MDVHTYMIYGRDRAGAKLLQAMLQLIPGRLGRESSAGGVPIRPSAVGENGGPGVVEGGREGGREGGALEKSLVAG